MKIQKVSFAVILVFLLSACNQQTVEDPANPKVNSEYIENIEVQKRIGDENKYEDFKEITNSEQVRRAKEILENIDWENAKVQMEHPPDYRFTLRYKNPKIEEKSVIYGLWISPYKDKVELVIFAESKYAQLDKNKSAELYEILTGEQLSGLK